MKIFRRFAFWLPFFSLVLILFELIVQPAESLVWMAFDPLFANIRSLLPAALHSLFILMLLHFLLALFYGWAIDFLIKRIRYPV